MRRYLRHPVDLPIQLSPCRHQPHLFIRNYSHGGLCCSCPRPMAPGTAIDIDIPDTEPPSYHGQGIVMWCQCITNHYEVGIRLKNASKTLAIRMAEQVCQIEMYRCRVLANEGRLLGQEEAACEWIAHNTHSYPRCS